MLLYGQSRGETAHIPIKPELTPTEVAHIVGTYRLKQEESLLS